MLYRNHVDFSIQMLKVLSFVRKGKKTKQRRLLRSDSTFDFRTDCVFCDNTTESRQFHGKSQVSCVKKSRAQYRIFVYKEMNLSLTL